MVEVPETIPTPPYHRLLTAGEYWLDGQQPLPHVSRSARVIDALATNVSDSDLNDDFRYVQDSLPRAEVVPISAGTPLSDHRDAILWRMVVDEYDTRVTDRNAQRSADPDLYHGRVSMFNTAAHAVTLGAAATDHLCLPPQAKFYWINSSTGQLYAVRRRLAYGVASLSKRQVHAVSGSQNSMTPNTESPSPLVRLPRDVQVGVPYRRPTRGSDRTRVVRVASADAIKITGEGDDRPKLVGLASDYLGTLIRTRLNPAVAT